MVAGPPILHAYEFEEKQDWVGIMLTPQLVEEVPQILRRGTLRSSLEGNQEATTGRRLFQEWDIPFKNQAAKYRGFALLPNPDTAASREGGQRCLEVALSSLDAMEHFAPDPGSQAKYREAKAFLKAAIARYP